MEAEWKLLLPALLASCSVTAAQGWLGYTSPDIRQEAGELIARLEAGQRLLNECTNEDYIIPATSRLIRCNVTVSVSSSSNRQDRASCSYLCAYALQDWATVISILDTCSLIAAFLNGSHAHLACP